MCTARSPSQVSSLAHQMSLVWEGRSGAGVSASFTPTANAADWAVEAFSLCMFFLASHQTLSEWSPMERRAPAQGSS